MTASPFEADAWMRCYIGREFEAIAPMLKDTPLEDHVLDVIASGMGSSRDRSEPRALQTGVRFGLRCGRGGQGAAIRSHRDPAFRRWLPGSEERCLSQVSSQTMPPAAGRLLRPKQRITSSPWKASRSLSPSRLGTPCVHLRSSSRLCDIINPARHLRIQESSCLCHVVTGYPCRHFRA